MLQKFNPKNKDLQIWVGDQLFHRDDAKISVFDSLAQGGDGVFVSESNATNVFMSKNGTLYTPFAHNCLPGITRGLIIEMAKENNIPCFEKDISMTEIYNADEVFVTGTMGELTTVEEVDGRKITNDNGIEVKNAIEKIFRERVKNEGELLPF